LVRICLGLLLAWSLCVPAAAEEPPALNPFGSQAKSVREDAVPGYIELSDGTIHAGQVFLTRDTRLTVNDQTLNRERRVPLQAVKEIQCSVKREWLEKEWRFKENANDEKVFTGRSYPSREYLHAITLKSGGTIKGPLSGIIYVEVPGERSPSETAADPAPPTEPQRFILYKRHKGKLGADLKSLVYVRTVKLGPEALKEGLARAKRPAAPAGKKPSS
jgi:hypothetical protein